MTTTYIAAKAGDANIWLRETWTKVARTKQIGGVGDMLNTQLNRCLSTLDITLLGIGHMVGSGVYVLTSSIAKSVAGPAIVLAFIISGFASLLAALCYAEFSVRFPRAGSAYSYAYLALGEFWAFTVGWNMVLENLIGIAAVSRACSAYIDSLLGGVIRNHTVAYVSSTVGIHWATEHIDFLACAIVVVFVVFLTCGVRATSYINNLFSLVNIAVIVVIVAVGAYYADTKNWTEVRGGFMPFGWKGVFAASASCFYAFIGFDSIATSGEEAKDPQRSIPIATMISMAFATTAYVCVAAVLTLMVPYYEINDESGLPDALGAHGAGWAKFVVISGACCGMVTVLIGTMYALTRIVYSMADDGLLFGWMSRVNEKTQIPLQAMYFFASIGAMMALVFPITALVEMMSIGTLLAYLVVSASVIIVRYEPIEPIHHSLSADFDNHQELNELSTSPRDGGEHLISAYDDRKDSCMSTGGGGWSLPFGNPVKNYFSRIVISTRFKKYAPDSLVSVCVATMVGLIFILCSLGPLLIQATEHNQAWGLVIAVLAIVLAVTFSLITLHEQNVPSSLRYKVPCVPFVPTLSIVFNVALMTNLQSVTWIRLVVWMAFGFVVYFGYGIHSSRLNPESSHVKRSNVRNWGSVDDHTFLADGTTDTTSIASAY